MTELVKIATPPIKNQLNDIWSINIRDHFPFDEVRTSQEQGFQAVEQAYRENKKFIIIEAPTGAGKSGIAIAAASYAKTQPTTGSFESGAYILSPQKSLTAQYMKDFESIGLKELKGRANYTCNEHTGEFNEPIDCEIGASLCSEETDEDGHKSKGCKFCPYKEAKKAFARASVGVTNFAYFLNETKHAGQLLPRKMLVLDEGHNTEGQILSLADILITKWRCDEIGVNFNAIPLIKEGQTQKAADWLNDTFLVAARAVIMRWEADFRTFKEDNDKANAAKLSKKLNGLKRFTGMVEMFTISVIKEQGNDWIAYTDISKGSDSFGCLIIKPLTATLFADDLLFLKADKVVIMSATIGDFDFFMRNLGINPQDAVTCRIDSDFPVEHRPVFVKPVANMSSTPVVCPDCSGDGCRRCYNKGKVPSIEVAQPLVRDFLGQIMTKYAKYKGIVHTQSYKLNQYMSALADHSDRVVTHTNAKGSRDEAIARHFATENPTVLFSPSMTEGLDLKDDLSRFSVLVKLPFAALTPYVKARMQRDDEWYAYMTALAIVQFFGRSNRHKEDKAHHFILDAAFITFIARWHRLFPKWFLAAIVMPNGGGY